MFAMLGKAFSLLSLGNNSKVAYFTNFGSAIYSSAAVMFLFWTITALAKKILVKRGETPGANQTILIMGAALVGALGLYLYRYLFGFLQ